MAVRNVASLSTAMLFFMVHEPSLLSVQSIAAFGGTGAVQLPMDVDVDRVAKHVVDLAAVAAEKNIVLQAAAEAAKVATLDASAANVILSGQHLMRNQAGQASI